MTISRVNKFPYLPYASEMNVLFHQVNVLVNSAKWNLLWKCKMYKDKEVKKNVKDVFFINVWRKNIFDIYVTEYGTALTTILPILFLYLNTVIVTAGTFEP